MCLTTVRSRRSLSTLPAELIALVIQFGASDDWLFPLRAAGVCLAWNSAACHYPRCWSKVTARAGSARPIHHEYQLVRLFIRRSCEAPIQLTLDLSRASDPQSVVFLRLFSRELARCTKFKFVGGVSHRVISHAFGGLWHTRSRVKEIILTLNTVSDGFAPESTLVGASCASTGSPMPRVFPSLQRLHLNFPVATSMPPEALCSIFASYPNLESLDLRLGRGMSALTNMWTFSQSSPPPFAPPRLRHLHIEGLSVPDLVSILDFKSLQLVSLHIHTLGVHARDPTATNYLNPPLPPVLCNPSSTLRLLELGGFSLSGPNFLPFMRMLRGLPELTKLSLAHVRLDAQLFHTLSHPMPGMVSWVVPRLECIELHHMVVLGALTTPKQTSVWVMDVARQRNVASKSGGQVARVAALKCDVVGRDGRVLLDLREMALAGPIGVQVYATGHDLSFFV